jgi:nitrosocyanin
MKSIAIRTVAALAVCASIMLVAGAVRAEDAKAAPGVKSFTLAAELVGTTKFWLPAVIVVEQGDKVKLNLKNDIEGNPNQHGFSIPGYNVAELVTRGEPKTVEFTADKAGVFPYICQIHPVHVGGQLIVLKKPK